MEVAAGWTHKAFPIDDPSRVGEARRHAAQLAHEAAFGEVDAGRLALVVTELGTNLSRHASKGRLLVAARPHSGDIEVLSIDEGPGIADLQRAMQDGQSSGSTPGTGLGAVRRLASDFDIHTSVPAGTICLARVRKSGFKDAAASAEFLIGAVCLPVAGEAVCGDGWAAAIDGTRLGLLVADGLGHGPEAAKASLAATSVFSKHPFEGLRETLQRVHVALKTTRGAAVCALSIDAQASTVGYIGAGNVVGRVVSGVFDRSLVTQHGTAGVQIRKPEQASMELPPHSLVIVHSDGIDTRWKSARIAAALQSDPAIVAAILLREHTRHRDDATVVVVRRKRY
ncbi:MULTISPECIES: ATP-binding SpoIIE family protein phosphatase [unclassified Variovorax]|uniref:ATP-binding SpoIIE family protein phosphatase n=1 Tax=unclassified Variovorax TaxID=663243 RepID=UPI00076C9A7E|nr:MULTISPECIES: ATP-binding SpoIIE family protein phosphatase [unclassified Variovorax]KWT72179.1 Anti-sigma B factor RsbT [Variovorax sp. WDL1]PNG58881.1 Serine/threonine-protein kinase RsbT [Variovorax sp. B4]PNG61329.1 Serine/threonine-protein kinase RsbT [Variovorax sp. B2]VTV12677.1 Serine/threonine-protein kinase RsbT [Variovorax sp. WDL1]